jgi:crossover junction endodeoxyribonuclease RusA
VAEYVIELPPGLPLLNANQRLHWAVRNRHTQDIKDHAWARAKQAKVPVLGRVAITVEYQPPDRRRRDADNLAPTGKAAIDGLVLAGVLPDDDSKHVTAVSYQIGEPFPFGRIVIRIQPLMTTQSPVNQETQ